VIRVIRVDFASPSAILLAIPRDLWVQIPGLEQHGIIENRIKTAYAYGNHYDVPGGGPSLLAQTLAQNFDLHPDHYVVVNFAAFEEGIDAIGGIDINVLEPLRDSLSGEEYFPAGWHMDGETALRYARMREDITDLDRVERQTQAVMAIRERVLSPQVLPSLPGVVQSMRASILTDLSPSEISMLMCIGERIGPGAIRVMSIDATMVTSVIDPWGHEVLMPDYQAIAELTQAFNAGAAP
jgi:LCP family protein required for cell wall assembly